jgi:hypothetical protein
MTALSAIGVGVFGGIGFMIKVCALYFFTEYLKGKTKEKLDNKESKGWIWASCFFHCLALSFILSCIYLANDGSYCVSEDMYGCSEQDYDPNFKPATGLQTLKYFGAVLSATVIAVYFRLKSMLSE